MLSAYLLLITCCQMIRENKNSDTCWAGFFFLFVCMKGYHVFNESYPGQCLLLKYITLIALVKTLKLLCSLIKNAYIFKQ